jgi:dTDP-4-amino-4,6-dideoxygalactose transaminase
MRTSEPRVPFNDISRRIASLPGLNSEIEKLIQEGPFLNGIHTSSFETSFAKYIGTSHCLGVSSGTTALELSLKALNLEAGTTVLLAANAGGYGSIAIQKNSLTSKYVDVDRNGLIDINEILNNLDKVGAVIVTHLYGQAIQLSPLLSELKNRGVFLIEDCAQATGAYIENHRAGSFGDISAFSFYPTKNMGSIGDAGAICTSNKEIFNRVKQLREYGWSNRYFSEIPGGGNNRIDEIHALILSRQLQKIDGWNDKRREIWSRYNSATSQGVLRILGENSDSFVAHLAVLQVRDRSQFGEYMDSLGIDTAIHYPFPDYIQSGLNPGNSFSSLPLTEELCNTVISVPIFPEMSASEIDRVTNALRNFRG